MNVEETIPLPGHDDGTHFIQFGISTWTENEPEEDQTESIRRAVYNQDGIFSPHGSSEIPIEDMGVLIRACIQRDLIPMDEIANITREISEYLRRRSG